MHDLLAAIYHKSMHLLTMPAWRPPVAAFATALLVRMLGRSHAQLAAALAVFAGWLALALPGPIWPENPMARMPGLGVLLVLYALSAPRLGRLTTPLFAALAAWWLRGAPLGGPVVASIVPVFLGLFAAIPLARRLAARDTGWTSIAAAAALAACIALSGGAMHWARAALVPAFAGLALIGLADATAILQLAIVVVAAATIVASDRGRFIPIDAAALAPLLVWFLAPRLQPRLAQAGPALAGAVAAMAGIAIFWGSVALFASR